MLLSNTALYYEKIYLISSAIIWISIAFVLNILILLKTVLLLSKLYPIQVWVQQRNFGKKFYFNDEVSRIKTQINYNSNYEV